VGSFYFSSVNSTNLANFKNKKIDATKLKKNLDSNIYVDMEVLKKELHL
jgi:hypothetical protein